MSGVTSALELERAGHVSTTFWIGGAAGHPALVAIARLLSGGTTEQTDILGVESSVRAVAAIAAGILLSVAGPWDVRPVGQGKQSLSGAARCTIASKKQRKHYG